MVINHFKQYYSGVTFREYLSMLGYDMTNVAQNAYFMIMPYGDENFTYAGYKGLNIDSTSGDIENINVKNSSGQGQTTVAVMFKKP